MKSIRYLLVLTLSLLFVFSCKNGDRAKQETIRGEEQVESKDKDQETNEEKLSARALGIAYLEENKLEDAEIQFKRVIELAPEEPLGHANLGIVYLRMGEYEEAEKHLLRARELAPEDPDIRLNLSKVYELMDESEKSVEELKKSVEISPDHVKSLYSLAETYSGSSDESSMSEWEKYINQIVEAAPTNIVSKLYLIEFLLKKNDPDQAIKQLEELSQLFPGFPVDAEEFYDSTLDHLHNDNLEEALDAFIIFHHFLKITNSYQSGIQELKGPAGTNIGYPVMRFSEATASVISDDESILEAIRFTDATESALLVTKISNSEFTSLTTGDFDSDGDIDVFYSSGGSHYLFQNEFGRYENIIREANIEIEGNVRHSTLSDYDNDGHLDLLILKENGIQLFANVSAGKFELVDGGFTGFDKTGTSTCLSLDADHDGDLDLFVGGENDLMFRNNGDNSFTEISEEVGFEENTSPSTDLGLGDFDDDGDIDLFVVREDGKNILYSNLRQGKFRDIAIEAGIEPLQGSSAAAIGDYNNDGYLDILIAGSASRLYKNKGDGSFMNDTIASKAFDRLKSVTTHDVAFLDFDNDGYLDVLTAGKGIDGKKGNYLLRNDGSGDFENLDKLDPLELSGGRKISFADYNQDGDLDFYFADGNGQLRLLRNDGGNVNHHLKIQLVGLRTGSGKNNYFGIGAKVEVRAGDMYQMQVVTSPNIHFGMGNRTKADVVRILWTNGVPQNIFSPGSDEDLIEAQELKGSCPFLYTWNGNEFVFVKDMMWRSALGMPMGIMGTKTTYGFPNASEEFLKIPGELLREKNGKYTIQITEELWETIYNDEIKLIAVDHPKESEIYVDEKFIAPPYPPLKVLKVVNHRIPVSVKDENGVDLRELISKKDNQYISNFKRRKYQGITELKDLILDLGNISDLENIYLFLNGWIFPTDASINVALAQSDEIKIRHPSLEVINEDGVWEEVIANIGFPSGKNKTVIVDLSNKFLSNQRKVRIRTNMEIYWDHIFFAKDAMVETRLTEMKPIGANHHYRGFSKKFRKGGRYGPHWFDYGQVSIDPKWRDLTGNYTRYGDVTELLQNADDLYIVANAGDETTIEFDATQLPELDQGWTRDFLIYSVGWVKDGDLNTASGQTVLPLPFHGMSSYPYGENENYPLTKKHLEYLNSYNTREIDTHTFQTLLSGSNRE